MNKNCCKTCAGLVMQEMHMGPAQMRAKDPEQCRAKSLLQIDEHHVEAQLPVEDQQLTQMSHHRCPMFMDVWCPHGFKKDPATGCDTPSCKDCDDKIDCGAKSCLYE